MTTHLAAPLPADEVHRLAALRGHGVLDTPPEPAFDRIASILQHVLGVPTVLVSLVDSDRQWLKARIGPEWVDTSRDVSFCSHAVFSKEPLVVPDATLDPRFNENPLVKASDGIRFYAGVPLIDAKGFALGTLCAIDSAPRPAPTPEQMDVMQKLAEEVVAAIELRKFAQSQAEQAERSRVMSEVASLGLSAATLRDGLGPMLGGLCSYSGYTLAHAYSAKGDAGHEFVSVGIWHETDASLPLTAFRDLSATFSLSALDEAWAGFLASGVAVLIADLSQERSPRAAVATALGLRSGVMVPVMAAGRIQGIVECYGDHRLPSESHLLAVADYMSAQLSRLAEREQANREKSEFITRLCSELHGPLQSISATFDLLGSGHGGQLPPKASTMLATANRNGLRLSRMIADILDVAKIESSCMPFERRVQLVAPLIDQALGAIANAARRLKVNLEFVCADSKLKVSIDPQRFLQVMNNLLSNAVKFSPPNRTVTVTLGKHGPYVRVEVADCGPGIAHDVQARVFEKFMETSESARPQNADTGLGLALVKAIVEMLDGTVSLQSQPGEGSVFRVDLPWVGD